MKNNYSLFTNIPIDPKIIEENRRFKLLQSKGLSGIIINPELEIINQEEFDEGKESDREGLGINSRINTPIREESEVKEDSKEEEKYLFLNNYNYILL